MAILSLYFYFCTVIINQASFLQPFLDQLYHTSPLEWLGTLTGFTCIYLAARQHILNWPVSIISIIAYTILFYDYKLYGDAFLQLYFLVMAVYGWYYWKQREDHHEQPVVSLQSGGLMITIAVAAGLSLLTGFVLDRFTDSDVPYIDGACTAMSFVAQFLMSRKILQNWILWIIVDACYIPLYLYKNLALTAVLYTLFLILAVMGYLNWKKTWIQSVR